MISSAFVLFRGAWSGETKPARLRLLKTPQAGKRFTSRWKIKFGGSREPWLLARALRPR
jgi:hypothetical protein